MATIENVRASDILNIINSNEQNDIDISKVLEKVEWQKWDQGEAFYWGDEISETETSVSIPQILDNVFAAAANFNQENAIVYYVNNIYDYPIKIDCLHRGYNNNVGAPTGFVVPVGMYNAWDTGSLIVASNTKQRIILKSPIPWGLGTESYEGSVDVSQRFESQGLRSAALLD